MHTFVVIVIIIIINTNVYLGVVLQKNLFSVVYVLPFKYLCALMTKFRTEFKATNK